MIVCLEISKCIECPFHETVDPQSVLFYCNYELSYYDYNELKNKLFPNCELYNKWREVK